MDTNQIKSEVAGLFEFSGRRGRKSYVLTTLGLIAAGILVIAVGTILALMSAGLGSLVMFAGLIPIAVANFAMSAQRFRDFGQSGCWVFLYLIPYVGFAVGIALAFIPPNPGANKYGEQP